MTMGDRSRLLEVHGPDKRFLVLQVQSQSYVEGQGHNSLPKTRQSGMIVVFYQDGERSSSASKKRFTRDERLCHKDFGLPHHRMSHIHQKEKS